MTHLQQEIPVVARRAVRALAMVTMALLLALALSGVRAALAAAEEDADALLERGRYLARVGDMSDQDLVALYRLLRHLGPAGEPALARVPPNQEPQGPFVQFPAAPE